MAKRISCCLGSRRYGEAPLGAETWGGPGALCLHMDAAPGRGDPEHQKE